MYNIKMVVFDMAGTTVKDENEVEHCFEKAAQATELPYHNDDILRMMGWSKRLVFETLWKKALPNENLEKINRLTDKSYNLFCDILETHYETSDIQPTDGCLELFAWLKEHEIKIALTTGFYRKVTNIILKRLGWDSGLDENYLGNELINVSVSSDEVSLGRPAPYMIFRCMEQLQITDPKSIINIGDTPSDLESGLKAHCLRSYGVTNGTHSRGQLECFANNGLLEDLIEFRTILEQALLQN